MTVRKETVTSATVKSQKYCKPASLHLLQLQTRIRTMARKIIAKKNKPILSAELEQEIDAVMAQFTHRARWESWGMDTLRKQGNMVLLKGPPGTGKTMTAMYMSKRVNKGMATLNMKDVGGKAPGDTERAVSEFFNLSRLQGCKTIFMDECEAIVWDRSKAGSDSMWMVGVIDEILMQTAKYPGLIIAATNAPDTVDEALKSRCFAVLTIGIPAYEERVKIWEQKMPERFPVQLTALQRNKLAESELSGRQIENAIVRAASMAITQVRTPTFKDLLEAATHKN